MSVDLTLKVRDGTLVTLNIVPIVNSILVASFLSYVVFCHLDSVEL